MDEADIAAERLEAEMERLLRIRRAAGPAPTGKCLWCGEPLRAPLRWCDADCRGQWQHDMERQHVSRA